MSDNINLQEYLNNDKIIIERSKDYGNYGELGKYFWCDKIYNCYHLIINNLNIDKLTSIIFKLKNNIEFTDTKSDNDIICYHTSNLKINIYDFIKGYSIEELCDRQNIIN